MSERKFYVLGTASQVPTRWRNHSGYMLRWDEEGMLFDPGEGTQRQMVHAGISVSEITKIFITHFHGDHCLGLAGIIQRLSLDQAPQTIDVFYPASGQVYYEHLRNASIFYDTVHLQTHPIAEPGIIFENDKIVIETMRLNHPVDTFSYRLQERDDYTMLPDKLTAAGIDGPAVKKLKAQGWITMGGNKIHLSDVSKPRPGQSFAFVLDTRICQSAYQLAHGVDLLVCEATYLADHADEADRYGHLTAADAARIAHEAGAKKLVLTHFSQRYPTIAPFLDEAKVIFPHVVVAKDGDCVDVPKRMRML